jgi:hypothetical protein
MKMIVTEVENEGLEALMGKRVTLFCGVYIYTGKLVGVNQHSASSWKTLGLSTRLVLSTDKNVEGLSVRCSNDWYVTTQSIESFRCT